MSRRVTSTDVARVAGVSRATVSYVLNDTPHQVIPERTRQRVFDAATRLGYAPSAAARTLRRGRSDVVLVLLPDWPIGHNVGQLIERLSALLAEHQLTVVVHHYAPSARPVTDVWRAIDPAVVIGLDTFTEEETAAIRGAGIEVAFAVMEEHPDQRTALAFSQTRLGRLQAERLAATGHRRIGYAWPDESRVEAFAALRLDGTRLACADLGLPEPAVHAIGGDECAVAAVRAWRDAAPLVTGVVAYNDDLAVQLLAAARQAGVAVPGDLAVIGADDIPAARYTVPALTTIAFDTTEMARQVTAQVVAALNGATPPWPAAPNLLELVVRESA